jgi:hypothetical protein
MIIIGIERDIQPIYRLQSDAYTKVPLLPDEITFITQAHDIFMRAQSLLKSKYEYRGKA